MQTHLCALDLAPLALPPDLPPVILMIFDRLRVEVDVVLVVDGDGRDGCVVDGCR